MNHEQKILHQKFVRFGSQAREWTRKCVLLLPDIEKHRIWEKKGFGSIYEYAAKLAGMNRETVNEALRILRKLEDKPELKKVVEHKGINAVKPIATIATAETAEFWAEKAEEMSKHTLETYVREYRNQQEVGRPGTARNTNNSQQQAIQVSAPMDCQTKKIVVMEVETELLVKLEKLKGTKGWNEVLKFLLEEHEKKLEEEKPEAVQTSSRHIPDKIKKYVLKRTNGNCAFPGCKRPSEIVHHTQRFALEKIHDPDRLYGLCKPHERIAHHGLIRHEASPTQLWKVKEHADKTSPTYGIDAIVQKYRKR